MDTSRSPADEATRWGNIIRAHLALVPPGTYSAVVGINESWPAHDLPGLRWRAAFELCLCKIVQDEIGLPYLWGAIPIGNLEPSEVPIFAAVFREAWATNAHLYLAPGATSLSRDGGDYYVHRPEKLWLPVLKNLGIPLKLLAAEVGTWGPPKVYPISYEQELQVAQSICDHYSQVPDLTWLGGCCFGVGLVGTMKDWDLTPATAGYTFGSLPTPPPPIKESPVSLQTQFPTQFAQWQAAGGVENNFRAHLLGIGVLPATLQDAQFILSQAQANLDQAKNLLAKLAK